MREEIVDMCVDVLRRAGHERVAAENLMSEEANSAKFLALLRDCRPLLVIRKLIAEVEGERARRGFPAIGSQRQVWIGNAGLRRRGSVCLYIYATKLGKGSP